MKKQVLVIVLAIFLTTIPISASELEIYPETVEIDLVGGDFVQVNITIKWSGSYSASCELTTDIEPDGEGINVTYSKNNFTMKPSSTNNIIMSINASLALMRGTYIITTNVSVEMEEQESTGDGDTWGGPYTSGGETIPDDENGADSDDDEEPPDDDEDEEEDIIDDESGTDDKPLLFPFWIVGIILFVIMLLYIISKRRKMAEKPGETQK